MSYDLTLLAQDDIDTASDEIEDAFKAAQWIKDIHKDMGKLSQNQGFGHRREDLTDHDVYFWTFRSRWAVIYQKATPMVVVRVLPWSKVTGRLWLGPGW